MRTLTGKIKDVVGIRGQPGAERADSGVANISRRAGRLVNNVKIIAARLGPAIQRSVPGKGEVGHSVVRDGKTADQSSGPGNGIECDQTSAAVNIPRGRTVEDSRR